MFKKLTVTLAGLILLFSCTPDKPELRAVSELTPDGDHLIKWETYPPIEGIVDIYSSTSPEQFDRNQAPLVSEKIEQGYVSIPPETQTQRTYFELVFNKQHHIITSERVIPMEALFNFRDLGGYHNRDNKQLKWGKIYRSSSLGRASKKDEERLSQLGIKTVIDLRPENHFAEYPPRGTVEKLYHIPLRGSPYNLYFDQVLSGNISRADVMTHLQETFYFFSEGNADYLTQVFDILLEESNYPVVIACSLGKDRSAVVALLLLALLEVNDNTIISDFLLSNDLIDYHLQARDASLFDLEVQQTLTALFSAHRETIVYTLEKIKQEHGSLASYMEKRLGLTPDKRARLKELLLYP